MDRSSIAIRASTGTIASSATRVSARRTRSSPRWRSPGEERRESEVSPFDLPDRSGYGFGSSLALATDASLTVAAGPFDGCLLVDTTIVPRSQDRSRAAEAALLAFRGTERR